MSIVRWSPFSEVDTFFNRMMPAGLAKWPRFALDEDGGKKVGWMPSADISETDKEYVIRAELPAVKKEDVHVTLEDDMLTIKGERKQKTEEKGEKFHRVESYYGSFERSFALPPNVKSDMIRCESKDGILSVHIPKTEASKSKPKEITVQ